MSMVMSWLTAVNTDTSDADVTANNPNNTENIQEPEDLDIDFDVVLLTHEHLEEHAVHF